MTADAYYRREVAAERAKTNAPWRRVLKVFTYIGLAVAGYAGAVGIVVMIVSMMKS